MEISANWALWVTLVTTLVFLYKYLTRNYGYWEALGVPCEKPYPIIGSEISMFTKPIHKLDMDRLKKHGRIYGSYFLSGRMFNVCDPEIIKSILVKDFPCFVNRQLIRTGVNFFDKMVITAIDDDWKRIRSIISPTFSSGKIKKMAPAVKQTAKKLTNHFLELAEKGRSFDVKSEFAKFSAEVLGACAFGINFDPFKNPNHPFLTNTKKIFSGGTLTSIMFLSITLLPRFMVHLKNIFMDFIGFSFFQKAAVEVIENRRNIHFGTNKPIDFLQLMIDAKDEKPENSDMKDSEQNVENGQHKSQWTKTMDENEIVAQCTTFLFAGHETVASQLSLVAYDLALNPDIQEILLREVDEIWKKHGDIDYDTVHKMQYLNAVIAETLRIHPVALRLNRQPKEDYLIPNTRITIPKKSLVSIPIYSLHHDPEFFPDPEKYDPQRFFPENKDSIRPYTYMPFGDGPRNCVAMRFAQMEMRFCLAYVLRYVKFVATEETPKLEFIQGTQLLQTKNGVSVKLEHRRPLLT